MATAYTPHPCSTVGQARCTGDDCGGTYSSTRYAGTCDPDGCDFNSYRMGVKDFYGKGMTVDTSKKFTVVTQFLKGSDGSLSEIKRFYVQGGKTIPNSESAIAGVTGNSITPDFCKAQKVAFGDGDHFNDKGGFAQFSKALAAPMVLVMSLWDDHNSNMLWLDSTYPVDGSADTPGYGRGSCDTSSGVPSDVESSQASDQVTYCTLSSCSDNPGAEFLLTDALSYSEHQVRPHRFNLQGLSDAGMLCPLPCSLCCSRTTLRKQSG
jgi:cellulose 1,4-beta-cellobiosidase